MILITGLSGFIGSHTAVALLEAGYGIVGLDNYYNSSKDTVDKVKRLSGKDFLMYECDILDENGLDKIFSENDIEAVIHFAGLKAVGESVEKPLMYYENNICGTVNLLKVMSRHNVKKIVFSSSATVYGKPEKVPIDETMCTSTLNPYGSTKLMIENILTDVYNSDKSWSVINLRYFNPIGAHKSGIIGENPNGIPNNIMPAICYTVFGRMKELKVFGTDYPTHDGTGVRDYIHVCDLAAGHVYALKKALADTGCFVYNLGTGTGYSVFDLIHTFERVNGVIVPYVVCDRRPGDTAVVYADPSKAENELGWKAKLGLEDMCRDSYNYMKKNQVKR